MGIGDFVKGLGGGLGSINKLQQLQSGMLPAHVTAILGGARESQVLAGRTIWSYRLHQYFKGWVPCHLVFESSDGPLLAWAVDEAGFLQEQQQWMAALAQFQSSSGSNTAGGDGGSGYGLNAEIASNIAWKASGAGNWQSR
jgi:hypothetical protein